MDSSFSMGVGKSLKNNGKSKQRSNLQLNNFISDFADMNPNKKESWAGSDDEEKVSPPMFGKKLNTH